jgi:hypothetical protein
MSYKNIRHPIGYDDIYVGCHWDNSEMCGACFAELRIDKVRKLVEEIIQAIDGKQYGWEGRLNEGRERCICSGQS